MPVQVDIKVVPVQDEDGTIEKVTKSSAPIEIKPEVRQETLMKEPRKALKSRKADEPEGDA